MLLRFGDRSCHTFEKAIALAQHIVMSAFLTPPYQVSETPELTEV
ncbi:MAG: hypothetical protein HEQ35_31210 [Gloeotrichia echinulata IR180]|jgi:hypothetical protein